MISLIEGFVFEGSFDIEDGTQALADASAGLYYINVHTEAVPSGEIRAQLAVTSGFAIPGVPVELEGEFSGDQEVPAVETEAQGDASVTLDTAFGGGGTFDVEVTIVGIGTDAARAMHIHTGAAGTNGGVFVNLDPTGALQVDTPSALKAAGFQDIAIWGGTKSADLIQGSEALDTMVGKAGNDTLNGGAGTDVLNGGNGKDVANGGNGADLIFSGNGNDKINGGNGRDVIVPGNGNDRVKTGAGKDTVAIDLVDPDKAGTDRLVDFAKEDGFFFLVNELKAAKLSRVDASDASAGPTRKSNVVILNNEALTLDEAQAIASGGTKRDGLIIFESSESGEVEIVYSVNLKNQNAEAHVMARMGSDTQVMDDFIQRDFAFVPEATLDSLI